MNSAAAFGNAVNATNGSPAMHEVRHTVGFDARWRFGAFGLDPTFLYQFGSIDTLAYTSTTNGSKKPIDGGISSFLFDVIGSWSAGPLLLEGRGVYSPGNKARDSLPRATTTTSRSAPIPDTGRPGAPSWPSATPTSVRV